MAKVPKGLEVGGNYTQASGHKVKIISKFGDNFVGKTTTPGQKFMIFKEDGSCPKGDSNDMIYGIR